MGVIFIGCSPVTDMPRTLDGLRYGAISGSEKRLRL
jgi:hypothetical protein